MKTSHNVLSVLEYHNFIPTEQRNDYYSDLWVHFEKACHPAYLHFSLAYYFINIVMASKEQFVGLQCCCFTQGRISVRAANE